MTDLAAQADRLETTDWRWLVICDGGRADVFGDIYTEYIAGDYQPVDNGGHTYTATWFADHFDGVYNVPLFHGGQPIHSFQENPTDYDEREHFDHVPDWRRYEWGDEMIQTSRPAEVARVVRAELPRAGGVIRFIQPHNPYRKCPRITCVAEAERIPPTQLRRAYRDNYHWVLDTLADLLPALDGLVVITADHGQALAEDCCGQVLHAIGHDPCPCLTTVPWLEIDC